MAKKFEDLSKQEQEEQFEQYLTRVRIKAEKVSQREGTEAAVSKPLPNNPDRPCRMCDFNTKGTSDCRIVSAVCANSSARPLWKARGE